MPLNISPFKLFQLSIIIIVVVVIGNNVCIPGLDMDYL